MDSNLYEMIFKRKSFHLFANVGNDTISPEELKDIEDKFCTFVPLYNNIKVKMKIVKDNAACKRGQEYCLYLYSEKKENYLQNIGYIGEQLDLYLVSKNIGTLWFGIGKPEDNTYDGLDYVIMFAIRKINDGTKFRKDMFKAKRKPLKETWSGESLGVEDIARFAPSACNSQPWYVESKDGKLTVSRYKKSGRIGIMPAAAVSYFNRIDIGIYLCILELCLDENGYKYERELFSDDGGDKEFTKAAVYKINS